MVAEYVVDGLEVVEVEEQQCDLVQATIGLIHGVLQPVLKQGAVGQASEWIVVREKGGLFRRFSDLAVDQPDEDQSGDQADGEENDNEGGFLLLQHLV